MSAQKYSLTVQKREVLGKKTKHLRKDGLLPANIFGDVEHSIAVTIAAKEFRKVYMAAGETNLVYLQLDDEKKARPILVDTVATDPLSNQVLHVSFRQVDLKEKVTAEIPVELIGELTVEEATPVLIKAVIEIEALPTDLIESFEIDLAQFTELDQQILVKDLKVDRTKIEIMLDPEESVLQIQKIEEMAEPEPEVVAEGAEGEAPAAGAEGEPVAEGGKSEEKSEGGEEKKSE